LRAAELSVGSDREASPPGTKVRQLRELYESAAGSLERSEAPRESRQEAAARLRRLARGEERPALDPIPEIEASLVAACVEEMPDEARLELRRSAEQDVAPYAGGMSPELFERAVAKALARRVRGRCRIPDLSHLPLPARR